MILAKDGVDWDICTYSLSRSESNSKHAQYQFIYARRDRRKRKSLTVNSSRIVIRLFAIRCRSSSRTKLVRQTHRRHNKESKSIRCVFDFCILLPLLSRNLAYNFDIQLQLVTNDRTRRLLVAPTVIVCIFVFVLFNVCID